MVSFSSKREVWAVLWIQNQSRAPIGRNKIERKCAWVSQNLGPKERSSLWTIQIQFNSYSIFMMTSSKLRNKHYVIFARENHKCSFIWNSGLKSCLVCTYQYRYNRSFDNKWRISNFIPRKFKIFWFSKIFHYHVIEQQKFVICWNFELPSYWVGGDNNKAKLIKSFVSD